MRNINLVNVILVVLLLGCKPLSTLALQQEIHERFPARSASDAVMCILDYEEDFTEKCSFDSSVMNYRYIGNGASRSRRGGMTILEFMYFRVYNNRYYRMREKFTPQILSSMIDKGADPKLILEEIIDAGEFDHFKVIVDKIGDPDAFIYDGPPGRPILHQIVRIWQSPAMASYVLQIGGNVNIVDPASGETPLLAAFTTGYPEGYTPIIDFLLDHGADPAVLDNQQVGLCTRLRMDESRLSSHSSLSQTNNVRLQNRLKEEFDIDCTDVNVP